MKVHGTLAVSAVLLAGCSVFFDASDPVLAELPEPPPFFSVFGSISFLVSYADASGGIKTVEAAAGERAIALDLPSDRIVPVVAAPRAGGRGGFLLSAGGCCPNSKGAAGTLRLSWEEGFASEILLAAASRGFPLGAFNVERFYREVRERGGGNPWKLDRATILDTLADLEFRADRIVPLKTYSVVIPGLEGVWISWNPLLDVFPSAEEGGLDLGYVSAGFHRFFRTERPGTRLDVRVEADCSVIWSEFREGTEFSPK